MTTKTPSPENTSDREIVISRVFDAPRELVWQAMTDPKHVANWWGPRGFSTVTEEMDVRPGGAWKHVMIGPDGARYPNKSIFKEVVKPERIVYTHGGGREGGGRGATFVATWTFEALAADKTRLTMCMVFPSAGDRDYVVKEFGAIEGGKQTLARLAEHLPRMRAPAGAFVTARVFNAPRELVFEAWTTREHLMQWWGPKGVKITTCKNDLRSGGVMHYCMRRADGTDWWGKWVYREIVRPERVEYINSFSDPQGRTTRHPLAPEWPEEIVTTVTFAEHNGGTLVTVTFVPLAPTEAERRVFDGGHDSMRGGWGGTLDQLGEYLSLAAGR
jgi:uncharacterized protein YndB with AHSA1/START domain